MRLQHALVWRRATRLYSAAVAAAAAPLVAQAAPPLLASASAVRRSAPLAAVPAPALGSVPVPAPPPPPMVSEALWFGLRPSLRAALAELGLSAPTEIQRGAIPRILAGEDVLLTASTGTGKTLAYLLPVAHRLKHDEEARGIATRAARPRALVVVPTRELALQVGSVAKRLCHCAKFSCAVLVGGRKEGWQKETLARPNDMLVATVGRLQHALDNEWLSLADVRLVVIDEADTMLSDGAFRRGAGQFPHRRRQGDACRSRTGGSDDGDGHGVGHLVRDSSHAPAHRARGGFAAEVLQVLRPVMRSRAEAAAATAALAEASGPARRAAQAAGGEDMQSVQVVLAGATMPRDAMAAVQRAFPLAQPFAASCTHRLPARLRQSFVRVGGDAQAKHDALLRVMAGLLGENDGEGGSVAAAAASASLSKSCVLVFCNTVPSARSTAHFLGEQGGYTVASLHGGIPPRLRQSEYELFLSGRARVLVCTDAAARGLDFPGTAASVVIFDFPLNSVEYLHRAGRAARAGRDGAVVSLVARRDVVLATALERAAREGLDLASLSAAKESYVPQKQLATFRAKRDFSERLVAAKAHGLRRPERPEALRAL